MSEGYVILIGVLVMLVLGFIFHKGGGGDAEC